VHFFMTAGLTRRYNTAEDRRYSAVKAAATER
jgi:hypothetical protein